MEEKTKQMGFNTDKQRGLPVLFAFLFLKKLEQKDHKILVSVH